MAKTSKKQRVVYKEDPKAKAQALERFLFGAPGQVAQLFERNQDEDAEDVASKGGGDDGLGFFEDRAGEVPSDVELNDDSGSEDEDASSEPSTSAGSEDDSDDERQQRRQLEGSEASSSEGSDGEGDGGRRARPAWADPGSDGEGAAGTAGRRQGQGEEEEEQEEEERMAARRAAGSKSRSSGRKAVWLDLADEEMKVDVADRAMLRKLRQTEEQKLLTGVEYEAALRKQHSQLHPRTDWAKAGAGKRSRSRAGADGGFGADSEEEEEAGAEGAEALLRSAGPLLGLSRGAGRKLPPGTIELSRLKDANQHEPNESVVRSVAWHPAGQLLMTAGMDKKIRLFQIDGSRNPKVQSIFLEDCPVHHASFTNGGAQIIAVGRRPHFYLYDLAGSKVERLSGPPEVKLKSLETFVATQGGADSCGPAGPMAAFLGDQGFVPLLSLKTRTWVGSLKMSGSVRSAAFSADGMQLLTAGGDGVVHTWDMRTRRCVGRMVDFGNKDSASLALAQDGRYMATGSSAGVVNIYGRDQFQAGAALSSKAGLLRPLAPTPLREIMNLTTTVDTLAFSPDSQMLAMASRMKKDAMRLVHLPSCTVFSNWPTGRSPLHYVHSLAFSPNGGFLAVGNARGRVLLYRLHHYKDV